MSILITCRRSFVPALALVAGIAGLAGSSVAGAATQSISESHVTVTLMYHGTTPREQNMHLTISRDDKVVYDETVTSKWCGSQCEPGIVAGERKVVHIVRLGNNAPQSIVLDLYSGGAHCCSIEQVYTLSPNSTKVRKYEHNFGDPGVQIVKLDNSNSVEFLSANDAFAYAFTDYAASGMPIEIEHFSGGSFRNVTRSYRALVARDAKQWIVAFASAAPTHYEDTVGVVAAWAADEDMLGHSGEVARFLAAQAAAGHLNSALSPVMASGEKYVSSLQRFLRQHGY